MRTLLFVQTGDGRPKCVRSWAVEPASEVVFDRVRHYRWWLVECENAEAGRELILLNVSGPWTHAVNVPGRILASGGKP